MAQYENLFYISKFLIRQFFAVRNRGCSNGLAKVCEWPGWNSAKMYQWQAESFEGNQLKARAAFSILEKGKTDPVFGVAWINADAETIGKQVVVRSARVTDIRLPGEADIPRWKTFNLPLRTPFRNGEFHLRSMICSHLCK